MSGKKPTLAGPNATITEPSNTIIGPYTIIYLPVSAMIGAISTTTGPKTTIARQKTTATGPNTTIIGPNTTMYGKKTTLAGPNATITEPSNTIIGPNTTITRPNTTVSRPNTTVSSPNTTTTRPNDTTSRGTASSSRSNLLATLRTYQKVPCDKVPNNRSFPIHSKTDVHQKQNIQERKSFILVDGRNQFQPQSPLKKQPSNLSGNSCPQKNIPRKRTVNTCRNGEDVIVGVDRVQNASNEPQRSDLSPKITSAKKQKRTISGKYPTSTPKVAPKKPKTHEYVTRSLGIRNSDESYSKINALVQKPLTGASNQRELNCDFTAQNIIDGDINNTAITFQETPVFYSGRYVNANYLNTYHAVPTTTMPTQNLGASYVNTYPVVQPAMTPTQNVYANYVNTLPVVQTDTPVSMNNHQSTELENPRSTTLDDVDTTYLHKKYRSVLVRTRRESSPVCNDRETPDTSMLETTVNLESQFLTHQPLMQTQTRTATRCTFTTATSATATPWGASANENKFHETTPADDLHVSNGTTIVLPAATGSPQNNAQNNSGSTTASLELPAAQVGGMDSSSGTVSGTGEKDALDRISQNRDYTQQMRLDYHIRCPLCTWTGPWYNLRHHIPSGHLNTIYTFLTQEWHVTFSLRALLTSGVWHSKIIVGYFNKYALSATATHGTFRATLTTLTGGTITAERGMFTVYNAVTGEPHSWNGFIPPISWTLPHENATASQLSVTLTELQVTSTRDREFGDAQITVIVQI